MGSASVRVLSSGIIGVASAAAIFLLFTNQSYFGNLFIIFAIGITVAIAYTTSLIANMTTSASYCGINMKRSSLAALIPGTIAGILMAIFIFIEPLTGLFSFPFNTIHFQNTMTGDWKTTSVFGLGLSIFWLTLYGQLVASGISEICETKPVEPTPQ